MMENADKLHSLSAPKCFIINDLFKKQFLLVQAAMPSGLLI